MRPSVLSSGLLALSASLAAAAPVPAKLTREFQAGVDAFRLGKYEQARARLEKAQAMDPKLPGPHRFLAAVARAQERWSDCLSEARRALQLAPQSPALAETRKLHEDCRVGAGRPAFPGELGEAGAIMVTSDVPGASVRIGGLRYGSTPVEPRQIKPGLLQVDVEKQGYKPVRMSAEVLPGIVTDIEAALERADAKPAEDKPAAATGSQAAKPERAPGPR